MNVLDENIAASQRERLKRWKIRVVQIGQDIGRQGMQDREQVIPLLQALRRPVLFTRDKGFFDRKLCHRRYGLVYLAVGPDEVADYVRRFLAHPTFATMKERMGKVVRVGEAGIRVWSLGEVKEQRIAWEDDK